jgi:hypothetical protein
MVSLLIQPVDRLNVLWVSPPLELQPFLLNTENVEIVIPARGDRVPYISSLKITENFRKERRFFECLWKL